LAIDKRQPPCSAYDNEDEDYLAEREAEEREITRPEYPQSIVKSSELSAQEMKVEYEKLVQSIDEKKQIKWCGCGLICKCEEK
jgi:hypothetical protein